MVRVVAAIIIENDHILVTRRLAGTHLGGLWEFPGGKIEPGESHESALRRELREEIGIEVLVGRLLVEVIHHYPEKAVQLFFYLCQRTLGDPLTRQVAEWRWVRIRDLRSLPFPDADVAVLDRIEQMHQANFNDSLER